jgi:hypothetical protein
VDHLKDLLWLALNLFEKADNFGYIDLDSGEASAFVEVLLGYPLKRKSALLSIRPEKFTQNLLHYP